MNALRNMLTHFCQSAQSERGKGTYFEDLTLKCFAHEPKYRDLYDWAIGFVLVMFIIFLGLRMKKWLCLQVKSYKESDDFGRSFYHAIGFVLVMFIILLGIYVLKFNGNPSGQPEDFGTFGDYIGGVLNPFIAFLALLGLWQTNKKQVKMLETQIDKEEDKDAERKQQDDFNRKFDSYKEVTAQITSQMLYPWATNEPAVSGKSVLSRFLKIIKQESIDINQGGSNHVEMLITKHLIQFMRPHGIGGARFNPKQLRYMNLPSSLFFINDFSNNIQLSPLRAQMKKYGLSMRETAQNNLQNVRVRPKTHGKNIEISILNINLAKKIDSVVWFFKIDNWRGLLRQDICSACEFEELGVYFRAVYHVLKSQKCDNYQAKENIRFFRSQLTESELVLIALNILFHSEGERELLPLVKQFGLLNHLFKFQNLYEIIETEPNYGKECFKEIE